MFAYHRDGSPVDPQVFAAMCGPLAHRAVNGGRVVSGANWRLAFFSWWTTPEEVGELQPLQDSQTGVCLAFEGRLDDRRKLATALGLAGGQQLSDAALVLKAYERWGAESFARLVGPFAVVVVAEASGQVLCARDQLGERTLVYAQVGQTLVVASEECAVLAHPGVGNHLNEQTVARYLAVLPPAEGQTFFAEVSELPPAHLLVADRDGVRLRRYWQPDLTPLPVRSEGEVVEEWRALLRDAVAACLRTPSRVGVLMSGGLDSTSVAAVAAQQGHSRGAPVAVSWVFDELPWADERRFMAPVVARHGLDWIPIRGDELWPLCPTVTWGDNPNGPGEAPSKALWVVTAAALEERKTAVLLTGESGDHLYFGWEYWLRDLLHARRFTAAATGVLRALLAGVTVDRRELWRLKSALGRAVGWRRAGASAGFSRRWLTREGAGLVVGTGCAGASAGRPTGRAAGLEDPWNRWGLVEGYRFGLRLGLEVRRPYRNLRLAQFAARVPSHLLARGGWSKWIGRVAVQELLPKAVAWRRWRSSHLPFVARGLAERGAEVACTQLAWPRAVWRKYVDEQVFRAAYPGHLQRGRDGAETVVAWQCVCLELWRQRLGSPSFVAGDGGLDEERECA